MSHSMPGSLDVDANVAELARLVVPVLGTWAIVSVVGTDGVLRDVGSWHDEPDRRDAVAEYSALRLSAFPEGSFAARSASTGEPTLLERSAYETIRARISPGRARDLLDTFRPEFVAVLPMRAQGETIGLLSVYADEPWSRAQREVADDLVARASLVIDNSLTYQRERIARAAAEAAEQRLSLLARVSETLSATDDPDAAVSELARVVVPLLADWAFVTVIAEDGTLRDIGIAHRDPAKEADLAAYSAVHLESMSEDAAVSRALRTAAPVVVPHLREEILTSFLPDPHVAELTRRLAPHGVASFPLTARGRTLGALTLATTSARGPHTEEEIALGLEISRRAGPVLDAGRSAVQARSLAESLQRGMLERVSAGADLQVATRYRPAYLDREIGGDWYDTFALPGGSTVVSIGDVMGHDVAAIAAMAQLRTLMRAVAWTLRRSPGQILAATDDANLGLGPGTFATALVAEFDPADADGNVEVRWSSAGHLPPVLIDADGTVRLLDHAVPGPPLGVDARIPRHDHTVTLTSGSVLLLYTDGLIERRDRDLETGLADLQALLASLPQTDVEVVLDTVLGELADGTAQQDDIALVAVRVGPAPVVARDLPTPLRLALEPGPLAPAVARDFVAEQCAHLDPGVLADLLLLTSEVVTNAIRYARPEYSLDLTVRRDAVRVEVNDEGPELFVRHVGVPDPTRPGGRGLLIVGAVATAWGVLHVDGTDAKSVWFELPTDR